MMFHDIYFHMRSQYVKVDIKKRKFTLPKCETKTWNRLWWKFICSRENPLQHARVSWTHLNKLPTYHRCLNFSNTTNKNERCYEYIMVKPKVKKNSIYVSYGRFAMVDWRSFSLLYWAWVTFINITLAEHKPKKSHETTSKHIKYKHDINIYRDSQCLCYRCSLWLHILCPFEIFFFTKHILSHA